MGHPKAVWKALHRWKHVQTETEPLFCPCSTHFLLWKPHGGPENGSPTSSNRQETKAPTESCPNLFSEDRSWLPVG